MKFKPKAIRWPGGNDLVGHSIASRFQWNNTIGPLMDRPGRLGTGLAGTPMVLVLSRCSASFKDGRSSDRWPLGRCRCQRQLGASPRPGALHPAAGGLCSLPSSTVKASGLISESRAVVQPHHTTSKPSSSATKASSSQPSTTKRASTYSPTVSRKSSPATRTSMRSTSSPQPPYRVPTATSTARQPAQRTRLWHSCGLRLQVPHVRHGLSHQQHRLLQHGVCGDQLGYGGG